jgi:ketosteroid isomerase-like protein
MLASVFALAVWSAAGLSDPMPEWTADQQAVIDAASTGPVHIHEDFDSWADNYHPDWTVWRMGVDQARAREPHMDLVRDFVATGAVVTDYELTPVDVLVRGDTAVLRYNAREHIRNGDGTGRVVEYSSVTVYAREDGQWLAIASNLAFPDRDGE